MEKNIFDAVFENTSESTEKINYFNRLLAWLRKTPQYTSFRVNLLKSNNKCLIDAIKSQLLAQIKENTEVSLPEILEIYPDTIIIGPWPENYDLNDKYSSNHEVIVDASCGAAVLRGSHVFAPGVMGLSTNAQLDDSVKIYADISGKCKRGLKVDFNDESKLFVGIGRLKMLRHEIFKEKNPIGIAIETIMPASNIPVLNSTILPLGECMLQNFPSIICSKVLNPQKGDIILDMCAAPGNKTSHIAEMMENNGIIIAIDRSESKILQIKNNCENHGITCVLTHVNDSTKIVDENGIKLEPSMLKNIKPPFPSETFDKILLDAPCSALGQRPLLKNSASTKTLKSYAPLQRKLFHSAVKLLKPSGTLVYSTCTITQAECESMVVWALQTFPDISLAPAEPLHGKPGWKTSGLTEEQRKMLQRFCPDEYDEDKCDSFDSIGFFIAKFEKNPSNSNDS